MTTHGGARPNSGPKRIPIDMERVATLLARGLSQREIGKRLGVEKTTINRAINRAKGIVVPVPVRVRVRVKADKPKTLVNSVFNLGDRKL